MTASPDPEPVVDPADPGEWPDPDPEPTREPETEPTGHPPEDAT